MHAPIILTAFGTSSNSISTYNEIGKKIQDKLPNRQIIQAYTSRVIGKKVNAKRNTGKDDFRHPEEVLQQLARKGYRGAILQSLHLFPGTEFHKLAGQAKQAPLPCIPGMPLLTSPDDYLTLAGLLAPLIEARKNKSILILGHGTEHPSWTSYYSLEKIFRQKFGDRIFVGVVEGFPDSSHLVHEISHLHTKEVTIIPLFLVAGMHYKRDITGDDNSWRTRLEERGLNVETIDHGIGLVPGIEALILNHIHNALLQLNIESER